MGGHLPGDGAQIMLNNTLESPQEKSPELPLLYQPIGLEHKRAKRIKDAVPVLVCLGNPPYDRHAAVTDANRAFAGGWVRWGESKDGLDAILEDFIAPVKAAGKGGDLKNLYNLYVYFWRWALWKTFEHDLASGPGVVSFITASSFIDGDAFLGMRQHMRRTCDEIWVIDLGGEGRGTRKDDNVFAIQTPVAITIAVRYGSAKPGKPAMVHYTRIEGARASKLHTLEELRSLDGLVFEDCSEAWNAPFKPVGQGDYFDWPLLTDLMPWQHSGVEAKRTWPIGHDEATLKARWKGLLDADDRAKALRESTDRSIHGSYAQFLEGDQGQTPIAQLDSCAPCPPIRSYGFRSFDQQHIIADARLIARPRAQLWNSLSSQQIFLATLSTDSLDIGPAMTVSSAVPDRHYFCGRGGKDILPLYRDGTASQPNLHPQLLTKLEFEYGHSVSADDFVAYLYGLLAQPAFTFRFHKELNTNELRVPLTSDNALFKRALVLGRELLFLHTYGERFTTGQSWPKPFVKCIKSVSAGRLPEKFSYDQTSQIIRIDSGEFGPVETGVWEYEVSGLKVVQSWLGYRMRNRKGKKSSPLDEITPIEWNSDLTSEFLQLLNLLTRTLELHSQQAALLDEILSNALVKASIFNVVPEQWRKAPLQAVGQSALEV